jgi:hypothetical protein
MAQYLSLLIIKYQDNKNFYKAIFNVREYMVLQYAVDLWLKYYNRDDLIDHEKAPIRGKILPNGAVDITGVVE